MDEKKTNFFTDENGILSMRRLLAFMLTLCAMGVLIASIIVQFEWKTLLVGSAVPLIAALLMMFFTSWSDIATVARAVKKGE